jgi:farnesyl diphosphate synthase
VKTKRVRDIYDELKLQKMYKAYEEESYNDIMSSIEQIPGEGKLLPPRIFTGLIDKIYQREN